MAHELWHTQTVNHVGDYALEAAAFTEVQRWIEEHGAAVTHSLALACEDSEGKTHLIATGDELAARARQAKPVR